MNSSKSINQSAHAQLTHSSVPSVNTWCFQIGICALTSSTNSVQAAKAEFFDNAGILDEKANNFELRMSQFFNWYFFISMKLHQINNIDKNHENHLYFYVDALLTLENIISNIIESFILIISFLTLK